MAQSSIDFLLNNNISIIQGIFAIIFILVVFVILRSFKKDSEDHIPPRPTTIRERREQEAQLKKSEPAPASSDNSSPLDDLDNLDDLMEPDAPQAQSQPEEKTQEQQIDETLSEPYMPPQPEVNIPPPADFVAAAKSAPGGSGTTSSPELTVALKEKEKVIADLRTEIRNLQNQNPQSSGSQDLQAEVKKLTEKLSEYEIIEDDIANLSFYKTENTKLKNELEKLKGTSAAKFDTTIAEMAKVEPQVAKAPAPQEPAVQAAANSVEQAPVPADSDDAILNEFEEAVKQKEALEKNILATESGPPVSVNPAETDLLKEFENAVEKELAPHPASATPKAAPAKEFPAKGPMAEINSDKLVQEAEKLATTKAPEAPDDGKDSNQKLIEEFENFVNKT